VALQRLGGADRLAGQVVGAHGQHLGRLEHRRVDHFEEKLAGAFAHRLVGAGVVPGGPGPLRHKQLLVSARAK
jgi:hypothetical protein